MSIMSIIRVGSVREPSSDQTTGASFASLVTYLKFCEPQGVHASVSRVVCPNLTCVRIIGCV